MFGLPRLLLWATCVVCAACAAPDFTERRALADPAMRLEPEPTEGHFRRKATDAREAGAGGAGSAAGGGCGCF